MSILIWDAAYSVGDARLDAQHRRLFALANRFRDAVMGRAGQAPMASIFDELIGCATEHFADEEALMRRVDHAGYLPHKASHDKLARLMDHYRAQLAGGVPGIELRVAGLLYTWLHGHVLGMDRAYKPQLLAAAATAVAVS